MTIIIGISGGVASGKNFVSDCFLEFGAKIFDADAQVAKLFSDDQNFQEIIKKTFPFCISNNKIDKDLIAKKVFNNKSNLVLLEEIIHPIINKKMYEFIENCKSNNIEIALLNVPLLFDKKSYKKCDIAILIISNINFRKERFIKRQQDKNSKISESILLERFDEIISNQKSDQEKEKLADAVIYNNSDQENIISQIKLILKKYEDNNC